MIAIAHVGQRFPFFLPHFDVICDLLLNRRTATWNLFVKYIYIYIDFSLPGLKVEITHCGSMKRKYRVINVTKLPAQTLKFPLKQMETGQPCEITVARYFQEKHKRRLQ